VLHSCGNVFAKICQRALGGSGPGRAKRERRESLNSHHTFFIAGFLLTERMEKE
jgi:hypothetical protein